MCANNVIPARASASVPGMEVRGDAIAPQKTESRSHIGKGGLLNAPITT
jgi:hypothetical protein